MPPEAGRIEKMFTDQGGRRFIRRPGWAFRVRMEMRRAMRRVGLLARPDPAEREHGAGKVAVGKIGAGVGSVATGRGVMAVQQGPGQCGPALLAFIAGQIAQDGGEKGHLRQARRPVRRPSGKIMRSAHGRSGSRPTV